MWEGKDRGSSIRFDSSGASHLFTSFFPSLSSDIRGATEYRYLSALM